MKLIIFDLDDTLFDTTGQARSPEKPPIELFPGAAEVLTLPGFKKVLVSTETGDSQESKIERLGIRHYFDEIHICSKEETKLEYFMDIVERHGPDDLIVVGNRIDDELRYGKKIGAKTIYFQHGKYANLKAKDELEIPDHVVKNMKELKEILFNG